jgi:hypothetical protein
MFAASVNKTERKVSDYSVREKCHWIKEYSSWQSYCDSDSVTEKKN